MALISTFLDDLVTNHDLLNSFESDPQATMTEYGLEDVQQGLILGNDLTSLRSALEAEVGPKPYIIVHSIVHATKASDLKNKKKSGKKGSKKSGKKKGKKGRK